VPNGFRPVLTTWEALTDGEKLTGCKLVPIYERFVSPSTDMHEFAADPEGTIRKLERTELESNREELVVKPAA
jgi:hypothetical protein